MKPRLARTLSATLAAACGALATTPTGAHAQLVSAGVGGGTGVGRRHGATADASHAHALGWVQLAVPLLPVALRGDALLASRATGGGPLALSANVVVALPVPIVTPYATAGWGRYGVGGDGRTDGWSVGLGARIKLPGAPGVFGEVRRHQRLGRDLATVGLVF